MALTSVGYPNTIDPVYPEQWADLIHRAGRSRYGVGGFSDWRGSQAAGDRVVQIAAGVGWGSGVVDYLDEPVLLPSLAPVSSGSRWDMVVARRDWNEEETTFAVITGGSSRVMPPRESTAGDVDEQPLMLVQVSASNPTLTIVDLRVMPGVGGALIRDELATGYLDEVGSRLMLGDTLWRRGLNAANTPTWFQDRLGDTGLIRSGLAIEYGGRFDTAGYAVSRVGRDVKGYIGVQHKNTVAPIGTDSQGRFASPISVFRMPGSWRPETFAQVMVTRGTQVFDGYINPPETGDQGGLVTLESGPPSTMLVQGGGYRVFLDYRVP